MDIPIDTRVSVPKGLPQDWESTVDSCRKFIVFGETDKVLYSERFWGGDIRITSPPPNVADHRSVWISGGYCHVDRVSQIGDAVIISGILEALEQVAENFLEAFLARLCKTRRVCVSYVLRNSPERAVWCPAMEHAGFTVTKTDAEYPYAIAVGRGADLEGVRWLNWVRQSNEIFVIATEGSETPTEKWLFQAVHSGKPMFPQLSEFRRSIKADPGCLWPLMDGFSVFYCTGGPDGNNVVLNLSRVPCDEVEQALRYACAKVGFGLFNCGDPTIPDDLGDREIDFATFLTWRAMPRHWRCVLW